MTNLFERDGLQWPESGCCLNLANALITSENQSHNTFLILLHTYLSRMAWEWPDSSCCRTAARTTFCSGSGSVWRRLSSLRARGLGMHVCGFTATRIGPIAVCKTEEKSPLDKNNSLKTSTAPCTQRVPGHQTGDNSSKQIEHKESTRKTYALYMWSSRKKYLQKQSTNDM